MIRGVVVILALIPLVLVLQGCGGGGGGACTNDKMMMVSQSVTMKGSVNVVANVEGMEMKQAIPMTVTNKIDMEWMRWYIGYETVTKIPNMMNPEQPEQDVTIIAKMMLDIKSKKAAIAYDMVGVGGAPLKTCNFMTVPFEGDAQEVSKCVKAGMETSNMAPPAPPGTTVDSSCSMEDGLDVWKTTIKNVNGTATEEWKFTKDFKLEGMTLTANGKQENQTAQVDASLIAESPATSTGPTDEDLDYTKWGMGNCTEGPPEVGPMPGPDPMPPGANMKANLPMRFKSLSSMIPLLMQAHRGRRLNATNPGDMPMPPVGPNGMPAGMEDLPAWVKCFMPTPPGVVTV